MTTPLTYAGFLVVFLGPPLAVLLALTWRRLTPQFLVGTTIVGLLGLLYTVPWDNALIARGVWWYGEGAVLATIYRAPVEEYAFIVLQPILTALWLGLLRHRRNATADSDAVGDTATWTSLSWRTRFAGVGAGLLVGVVGAVMLSTDATFYVGAILAWAAPILVVQWAFGWTHLWRNRKLTALAVGVPTAYLGAADRIAIELGIWSLSPRYTTGVLVAGLPIEEGAFFLLTNVFVVQGLLLFLWVVERPTPADTSTTVQQTPNS
jgi:lycopene cyclase domain-containing protein